MTKIVINKCWGGFGISHEAVVLYAKKKGLNLTWDKKQKISSYMNYEVEDDRNWFSHCIDRTDPILIAVVEELEDLADGDGARLQIVEIPDNVKWEIDDYDGQESIHEVHRSW